MDLEKYDPRVAIVTFGESVESTVTLYTKDVSSGYKYLGIPKLG